MKRTSALSFEHTFVRMDIKNHKSPNIKRTSALSFDHPFVCMNIKNHKSPNMKRTSTKLEFPFVRMNIKTHKSPNMKRTSWVEVSLNGSVLNGLYMLRSVVPK